LTIDFKKPALGFSVHGSIIAVYSWSRNKIGYVLAR
jgi:hypothetical protein